MKQSNSYTPMAADYERVRGGERRARQVAEPLLRWLPTGDDVLIGDVGAGTGVVGSLVASTGRRVLGFDLSIEMLSQATPRPFAGLAQADAQALPVQSSSLDAVYFVWVMHHVASVERVIEEAHRVLRPGGRLISVSGLFVGEPDEIGAITLPMSRRLRPEQYEQDRSVGPVAEGRGFELVGRDTASGQFEVSPESAAQELVDRQFSYLWDLDDAEFEADVAPVVARLRALPDPDRQRTRFSEHEVVVFDKRGATD